MQITQQQYEEITDIFPYQRGNVAIDNLTMLNVMLHVLEHGRPSPLASTRWLPSRWPC